MTARWLWIPLLILGMVGCSVRRVEEVPSDRMELEDLPAPVGGFFNHGGPLYSTDGWWPSHYTERPITPPIRPPSAYDRRPPQSRSPRPSMQAASSYPQAPERHITQQAARAQRVESRKRMNTRRDPDFRERDRRQRVERLRRARQEAARTLSEDEEERKEEASRRRKARAKKRL